MGLAGREYEERKKEQERTRRGDDRGQSPSQPRVRVKVILQK